MKRLPKEDRAGLYITVIVHLTVIVILLAGQLGYAIQSENSFVLDFTKQEQIEKLRQELALKEEISRRLQDMLDESGVPVRNVAVDRGSLKDDRNTDAEQLYKDAEKLREELANAPQDADEYTAPSEPAKEDKKPVKEVQKYSGPSVISYQLDGRKARKLPIPAYRCMGAGEVTVLITVNNQGDVIGATVDDSVSSSDKCLRDFAIRAARISKFAASQDAPAKQMGNIVYCFIAQ